MLNGSKSNQIRDVEKYKSTKDIEGRKLLARNIWQKFVSSDAILELNIANEKRKVVESQLNSGKEDIFDELQRDIEIVMNDTFQRFERSKEYEAIVKKITLA